MLAEAVAAYAGTVRDRRVSQRTSDLEDPYCSPSMDADKVKAWARAMSTIRITPVYRKNSYGVKISAHPSIMDEVSSLIDAVTGMNGHTADPIIRTDNAIFYRWG